MHQGYCGLENVPLPGRLRTGDDVAIAVSNVINPIALTPNGLPSIASLMSTAQPHIGDQVTANSDQSLLSLQTALKDRSFGSAIDCTARMC